MSAPPHKNKNRAGDNVKPEETYGKCLACGSVEVKLNKVTGTVVIPEESDNYPAGYGCELCD